LFQNAFDGLPDGRLFGSRRRWRSHRLVPALTLNEQRRLNSQVEGVINMISPAHQRSLRRRLLSLSCLLSGCLALAASARAQMGGVDSDPGSPGTGGRNIIEGRVYYPSGRNVD